MIKGIGIDILESHRILEAVGKVGFLDKYYTDKEKALQVSRRIANNFVVKEAVAKAFGLGFHKFSLRDIEVLRNELGKPYVKLHGKAKQIAMQHKIRKIHVSLSDTKEYITAVAILEH